MHLPASLLPTIGKAINISSVSSCLFLHFSFINTYGIWFNFLIFSNVDKTSGATARGEIGKSWTSLDKLGSTPEGLAWLKDRFKLCQEVFNTTEHVAQLKDYLNMVWTNVAMMDYPYPTSFLMPLPGKPVEVDMTIYSISYIFYMIKFQVYAKIFKYSFHRYSLVHCETDCNYA